jgi:Uncharacterized conserved protein
MSTVTKPVFGKAISNANSWINEIARRLKHNDKGEALRVLRVVLHALRDRLTIEEAVQLSAQLPLVIRGMFFEGWSPFDAVKTDGRLNAFFAEIAKHLPTLTERERTRAVQVVFDVLAHHVSQGEVDDIAAVLPASLKEFWFTTVAD